jgi:hypothetical protein
VVSAASGGTSGTASIRFKNADTGLYIDGMGRTTNGSATGQWSSSTSENQQWSVSIDGNNVRIKNRASGLYLEGMGFTTNGADLGQNSTSNSVNQRFQIVAG